MDTNILLESGTNELELLEFIVGQNSYGINIAKVSEIMIDREVTPMPNSPEEIEGVFIPRDKLISVLDLHKVLKVENPQKGKNIIIVCQFNKMHVAFHVTAVCGRQRVSWNDINDPRAVTGNSDSTAAGMATGVAKINGKIIIILDFEKIVSNLNRSTGLDTTGIDRISRPEQIITDKRIIVADDSQFLNKMIVTTLGNMGCHNVVSFQNGSDAWDYIKTFRGKSSEEKPITDYIGCIISDIEMPKMDGHHLTKLIKSDDELKRIPVILFSSLIDEQMKRKGESVGADAQFSKPQIKDLIEALIMLLREED